MRLPAQFAKLLRLRGLFMVHRPETGKLFHDWFNSGEFVYDFTFGCLL